MFVPQLDPAGRETLLAAAVLAPSMLNTQPWRFRLRHQTVEVHRDPARELPVEDPERRMAHIGVGAVVFNLRVAAAHLGLATEVRLLPDVDRPLLAAEVTLCPARTSTAQAVAELAELYPYVARRHSNRQPFSDRVVPASVRESLRDAAMAEGAMLEWVEDAGRLAWLLRLAGDGAVEDTDAALRERRRWVGGERTTSGIPSALLGPRPTTASAPVRDLAADDVDLARPSGSFEAHPQVAVLSTTRDDPRDWIVAGEALQSVLLASTANGLASSLFTQSVEHPDLRWLVRDPQAGAREVQVLVRFGYGPEVGQAPRRPLSEFLVDDDRETDAEVAP